MSRARRWGSGRSPAASSIAPSRRSASAAYESRASDSAGRDVSTRNELARASETAAVQIVVLPMPASPSRRSARGPLGTSSRNVRKAVSSFSRPRTVGLSGSIGYAPSKRRYPPRSLGRNPAVIRGVRRCNWCLVPAWIQGSTKADNIAGDQPSFIRDKEHDDSSHLIRRCHVEEIGALLHSSDDSGCDPSCIGDWGVDYVRRHAVTGQFERRRHREVLLGCLCCSVGHLSGEPVGTT